jgi:hypothetical protein
MQTANVNRLPKLTQDRRPKLTLWKGRCAALQAWLTLRGPEAGPLFIAVMNGGPAVVRHLIAHAI